MGIDSNQPVEVEKGSVLQKDISEPTSSPPNERITHNGQDKMTAKTWFVIFILSSTFGLSFWPVPTTAAMQATLAARWGTTTALYWFIPAFTTGTMIEIMDYIQQLTGNRM